MTDVPDAIEEIIDDDSIDDVTESYEETIEACIDIATARTNPIPIKHAVAYQYADRDDVTLFAFAVDVDRDVLDREYIFELAVSDSEFDGEMSSVVLDQFSMQLRSIEEKILHSVLNMGEDDDE